MLEGTFEFPICDAELMFGDCYIGQLAECTAVIHWTYEHGQIDWDVGRAFCDTPKHRDASKREICTRNFGNELPAIMMLAIVRDLKCSHQNKKLIEVIGFEIAQSGVTFTTQRQQHGHSQREMI